jgi:anti-sigma B factor antagonist
VQEPEHLIGELLTDVQNQDGVCLVKARGEVDISNAQSLRSVLQNVDIAEKAVIVDISGVTYMDSSGFAVLLETARRLRPRSVPLHLVGSNATITRLMEITRLNTVFVMHQTLDDAQAAI